MNRYITILISFIFISLWSCNESDELESSRSVANGIFATFDDGSGFFNPETPSPYGDTIKFIFTTHFPVESDQPINISKMRLNAYSPVKVEVAQGEIIDLSKVTPVTIIAADGTKTQHVVKGVIRKSAEAQIKSFSLPAANLDGLLIEKNQTVGLVSGGMNLKNMKPKVRISAHATISPDTSLVQDFTKPVTYTVTAENGTQVAYTVKAITPEKMAAGLRPGSGRLLWSKNLIDMGINNIDHMSTSLAISEGNLIVNTRNVPNRYFDRYSGEYIGEMTMGDIFNANLKNFFSTNDDKGNILICNLTTSAGQDFVIYKWKGADDAAPVKLVQWKTDITGGQIGRKMSVKGDLNGDAVIYVGAAKSNNTILRWQVTGGVIKSEVPEKIIYPGVKKWDLYADVAPVGNQSTDKVFLSGNPADFVCTDLATGGVLGQLNLSASGYSYNHSIDFAVFNNSNYLSAINIIDNFSGNAFLYDVTDPSSLATLPASPDYAKFCMLKTETIVTNSNGNKTGDVLLKVSDDGYKMIMYAFVTNGSILAYEFDCIDMEKLMQ